MPRARRREEQLPSANLGSIQRLESQILFEDDAMIVLNKPSGMAVQRQQRALASSRAAPALRKARFLELVHRLDRDTSGVLLVAKKRSALRSLHHEQLRVKTMRKAVPGAGARRWQSPRQGGQCAAAQNDLQSGERVVRVSSDGKPSETRFRIARQFAEATLVECSPITGRTHQIGFIPSMPATPSPAMTNTVRRRSMKDARAGLKRLFLHAWKLSPLLIRWMIGRCRWRRRCRRSSKRSSPSCHADTNENGSRLPFSSIDNSPCLQGR